MFDTWLLERFAPIPRFGQCPAASSGRTPIRASDTGSTRLVSHSWLSTCPILLKGKKLGALAPLLSQEEVYKTCLLQLDQW